MADTLDITAGAGTTIATDDIGSVHYQEIKLIDGTKDSTTPVAVDIGVKANALRVAPANDITDGTYIGDIKFGEALYTEDVATAAPIVGFATMIERDDALGGLTPAEGDWASLRCDANGALWVHDNVVNTLLGTIDTDTGNMVTALQLLDNAVDGNYLNCNLNIAGTDCVGNSGVLAAGVLRVTIATDDECNNFLGTIDADTGNIVTAVQLIDDAIYIDDANWTDDTSKHMLVGGVYQSTDHTVTDGDVSPFQVDVNGCIVLGTGAKAIGKLAANSGVDIGDVTINNANGAAAVHIQDGGNTITVDGTVTADLSATDNAVLDAIDTVLDLINGKLVTGTVIGDVNLGAVDNAVLDVIAGDTTAIETAIQIMDDWDATHASAAPVDGAQVMGAAYSTALPADVGADADAARLVTDRYGRLCTGLQPQAAKATLDNADTTTARAVVAATATRRIFITSLILSVDTAGNYWLEDGDATAVTGKFYLAANGGVAVTFPEGTPLNTVTQNKALNVKGSTAGNVSVTVTYYLAV